ncbi:MAG: hypothetical protein JNJ90_05435 [Saprospiraceae bacterium]|jgi:hypothetical protein|nr:hypothetical protein [Saprospiraceae bacterium]
MQDLVDLIEFIQKTKFKSNSLLEALIRPDSQLGKVFHAIAKGDAWSDQDLLDQFPELGSLQAVATLRNRLKNRLCDAVFLLDFREENYPDRQVAFVECVKKWSAAMILITKNIRSIGIKQLENLLRHTLEFEFTEMSMNIIRTLELYYGTIEGNQRKFSELEETLLELEAAWLAEQKAERLYSNLVMHYVHARADKYAASEKAKEYFDQILPLMQQHEAFKVHFFGYLIKTVIYDSLHEYDNMEQVCLEAVSFFDTKKYRSGMVQQTFYYNLLTCYLNTRQFEKGLPYFHVLEQVVEPNSFNWFKLQELHLMTAMHSEKYREGVSILEKVKANTSFLSQPSHLQEIWRVFEAYLYYLMVTGVLPGDETRLIHFRMSRFLNEVPVLSKDKRGMNIAVLIVQFLYYSAMRMQDECENRIDALKKYSARYLNDDMTLRNRCFIKMILQIPTCSFDSKLIRKKTQESFAQLQQMPWHTVNQHREVEVIPYEHLWLIVLRSLENPGTIPEIVKPSTTLPTVFEQKSLIT